jgi:polysaccharide biosynthesis protein PslG
MIRRLIAALVLIIMVLTMGNAIRPVAAQPSVADTYPPYQARYFAETGHTAVNWFLETWKNTPNALFTLGYPISQPFIEESFTEPGKFYRVQYFERGILEEHPENFGTQGNRFYILGRLMGSKAAQGRENEAPFVRVGDPGDGSWFSQTGHTLRNSPAPFRTFWESNGGLATYGYPISEQFQERNAATGEVYWVQYFERQRMEWQPNQPDPRYRVLLGLLGNEYRDRVHRTNPAFTPGSAPAGNSGGGTSQFVYGYNAHLYWQDKQRVLQASKDSGITWIRQQVRWMDHHDRSGAIYWNELDPIVEEANRAGVKLFLSVVSSPTWATSNGSNGMPARDKFDELAYFMGEMAKRYRGKVGAYQLWNEMNRACENGGNCAIGAGASGGYVADAGYYVDMLAAVYPAVKAGDPNALVVSGAPAATNYNDPRVAVPDTFYMASMARNPKFAANVDIIGLHPGGAYNPPDSWWPGNPGPGPNWQNSNEFYFRRIEDIRKVLVDNGLSSKPIWITEFGWATRNNTPGYEFGNRITAQQQADWIVRAFQIGRREWSPWVTGMFVWNLNFAVPWKAQGNELHEQASFGVLNGDWSPRPAYTAIKNMPKD